LQVGLILSRRTERRAELRRQIQNGSSQREEELFRQVETPWNCMESVQMFRSYSIHSFKVITLFGVLGVGLYWDDLL